ncbi:MAG: 1,4-beta-xylanase, partial [Chitinophagaceae bacterium]
MMTRILSLFLLLQFSFSVNAQQKWTATRANEWYGKQGWLRGCNFQPSTAINQLEMFQPATFDTATLDRELGLAGKTGFNVMRVFLHHLLWTADKEGFKKRINQYLDISTRHGIKTMFVFFDDCWNDTAWVGTQPSPKVGVHNSGWVRDPGTMILRSPDTLKVLEQYVTDVVKTFGKDNRILCWDLYNEPGNNSQFNNSLPLVEAVFKWARAAAPTQPLTCGVWNNGPKYADLNKLQFEQSDIITYHNYSYIEDHQKAIDSLKKFGRPVICTEYMAR